MKKVLLYAVILACLCSCESNAVQSKQAVPQTTEKPVHMLAKADLGSDQKLDNWLGYYQSLDSGFSLDKFALLSEQPISEMQGTIQGVFDKDFDKIYTGFLVYSPDSQRYVDFDSYNWTLDDQRMAQFEPDQEINLVNVRNKTVTRIGFRGPSQWVEDAFWKNDSMIVLLENTEDNRPVISLIDLNGGNTETYQYKDTLPVQSLYSRLRLKSRGIRME